MSEINKEFRPYFRKAGSGLKGMVNSHPKFLFVMMVVNITLSVVLSFRVLRHRELPPKPVICQANPVGSSFEQILQTGEKLKRTIILKRRIDSLTAKRKLDPADSVALENALDTIQNLIR